MVVPAINGIELPVAIVIEDVCILIDSNAFWDAIPSFTVNSEIAIFDADFSK